MPRHLTSRLRKGCNGRELEAIGRSAHFSNECAPCDPGGQLVHERLDAGNRGKIVKQGEDFFTFYNHDIIRAAVAVPRARVADPFFNAQQVITLMGQAAERQAAMVHFPDIHHRHQD